MTEGGAVGSAGGAEAGIITHFNLLAGVGVGAHYRGALFVLVYLDGVYVGGAYIHSLHCGAGESPDGLVGDGFEK